MSKCCCLFLPPTTPVRAARPDGVVAGRLSSLASKRAGAKCGRKTRGARCGRQREGVGGPVSSRSSQKKKKKKVAKAGGVGGVDDLRGWPTGTDPCSEKESTLLQLHLLARLEGLLHRQV